VTSVVPDALFVIAAYVAILGALAGYGYTLARRLRRAERAVPRPGEPADPDR
jgi:hypothetical protein